MLRTPVSTALVLALALVPAAAAGQGDPQPPQAPPSVQTPQPAQAPKAEKAPPERRGSVLDGQPVNVRIEITITDQQPESAPVQKTVSLVLADRTRGMVRSEVNQTDIGSVPLRVDARASVVDPDLILAEIALDYSLPGGAAAGQTSQSGTPSSFTRRTQLMEQLNTLLKSGKPIVVSESADPITDRKVRVEVKATILR